MNARSAMRVGLAVVLILVPVIAPWLVAEFRQASGAELVACSGTWNGGAA